MSLVGTYDPSAVILTVDGLRIQGFSQDAAVTSEKITESEVTVGGDGFAVISVAPSRARIVTVTLLETSPGYRILADFWSEQRNAVGALPPRPFNLEDLNNGDVLIDPCAVLYEGPVISKGARVGTREFKFLLPDPTEKFAQNIQE